MSPTCSKSTGGARRGGISGAGPGGWYDRAHRPGGVEAGAEVSESRIVGPVIMGSGERVSSSYVGPFTSVASDCVIANSEIKYPIALRGAPIQGCGGSRRLIGHDVEVTPSPRVPRAHRLVLGDHSKVQISS